MAKTHWLYGRGPEKLLEFAREVDVETDFSCPDFAPALDGDTP